MTSELVKKVVLCGTHPNQFNGYSKVVYELSKALSEQYKDVELYIFGFQNFYKKEDHEAERTLPNVKEIYDAYANEDPKAKGFGEKLIVDYIKKVQPELVVIYNDLVVITNLMKSLNETQPRSFKLLAYIDIVYKNEKNNMIKAINDSIDGGIMFTSHWKDAIIEQGFTKPLYVLEHGFNSQSFYPIPQKVARKFYNIPEDDFVIVNLNRNQPRKRWDICIMSFIKFISTHLDDKIKLLIATSINGAWDLVDVMTSECRKYNITFEELKKHLIIMQNPQQVTDREVNVLYNVGDIGVNTCDGEGFGLCNFEQAGVGIPQVVPKVGGFIDFLNKDSSIMIQPKWSYYTDHSRDFVSGEAEVCDIDDFVNAYEYYFKHRSIVSQHGIACRKNIVEKYGWDKISKKFHDIIVDATADMPVVQNPTKAPDETISELDNNAPSPQTNVVPVGDTIDSIDDVDIEDLISAKLQSSSTEAETVSSNAIHILPDVVESNDVIPPQQQPPASTVQQIEDDEDDDDEVFIIKGGS